MNENFLIFILLIFTMTPCIIKAQDKDENSIVQIKHLAPTPPKGWNSWNCFGTEVTEAQVKAVADYMAEHLKEYGWEYVVVDAGWYQPPTFKTPDRNTPIEPPQFIDEFGRLMPDTIKFPSAKNGKGFKPLADYVQAYPAGKRLEIATINPNDENNIMCARASYILRTYNLGETWDIKGSKGW